jgi:VIT1/CCC1 family predicted Fe2+/Mn2+ transporter
MQDTEVVQTIDIADPAASLEPHIGGTGSRMNWLRAAVLGANDGIVSIAGLVVGVAGATSSRSVIFTAGLAGVIAGALSMAAGEYVSVSSQRDTEEALLTKERLELANSPEQELEELVALYEAKGLTRGTARQVASELTSRDAFAAHADAELHLNAEELTNPWHAAIASALAFLAGAMIPLVAIMLPPAEMRVPVAFISVVFALAITGALSAKVGGANMLRAATRVVIGGALAMLITYVVGSFFRIAGI